MTGAAEQAVIASLTERLDRLEDCLLRDSTPPPPAQTPILQRLESLTTRLQTLLASYPRTVADQFTQLVQWVDPDQLDVDEKREIVLASEVELRELAKQARDVTKGISMIEDVGRLQVDGDSVKDLMKIEGRLQVTRCKADTLDQQLKQALEAYQHLVSCLSKTFIIYNQALDTLEAQLRVFHSRRCQSPADWSLPTD